MIGGEIGCERSPAPAPPPPPPPPPPPSRPSSLRLKSAPLPARRVSNDRMMEGEPRSAPQSPPSEPETGKSSVSQTVRTKTKSLFSKSGTRNSKGGGSNSVTRSVSSAAASEPTSDYLQHHRPSVPNVSTSGCCGGGGGNVGSQVEGQSKSAPRPIIPNHSTTSLPSSASPPTVEHNTTGISNFFRRSSPKGQPHRTPYVPYSVNMRFRGK